jgi:hypothetical protein
MSPKEKFNARVKALHAKLGSSNAHEVDTAWKKLHALLIEKAKTWNDLPAILAAAERYESEKKRRTGANDVGGFDATGFGDISDDDAGGTKPPHPDILSLVVHILKRHLHFVSEWQYVVIALWIVHTHVYRQFSITPRLVLESPVRDCGKTTLLRIVGRLGAKPRKIDDTTAASLFRIIDRHHPTVLLDEVDNSKLHEDKTFRTVVNSGHSHDGAVSRFLNDEVVLFSTFSPMVLAAIGKLPMPLLSRSVVIFMERAPATANLIRFDELNADQMRDCLTVYTEIANWARNCKLNTDPPMPAELRNRRGDNYRVLVAIADACGEAWSEIAREAIAALGRKYHDEDVGVVLLSDIRDIFNRQPSHPVAALASKVLIAALYETPDGRWSEWRGIKDDQQPRQLSQGELARLLRPFRIRPKSIWPSRRTAKTKSAKGYYRKDFEAAWASYLDGTAARPSNITYLRKPARHNRP